MKFNNETRAFGSIRKTRRWGTCGVILGLAALMGTVQVAKADESTSFVPTTEVANTASNLKDSQPAPTADNQAVIGQANQAQGSVSVTVDNTNVTEAVAKAKAEGVNVVKDPTVDKGTTASSDATHAVQSEIATAQNEQQKQIEQVTSDYVSQKDEYKKEVDTATSNNKKIQTENQALEDAYKQATAVAKKTQKELNLSKEAVKQEFPDAKITETTKTIVVDPNSKSSYDQYTQIVNTIQKSNKQAVVDHAAKVKQDIEELANRNQSAKEKVDADNKLIMAENNKIVEDQKRYEKELAEAEKNKTKDGWLSEVATQALVYKNEPNAMVDVKGVTNYISAKGLAESFKDMSRSLGRTNEITEVVTYFSRHEVSDDLSQKPDRYSSKFEFYENVGTFNYSGKGLKLGAVTSKVGQTITVTYSNLKNSTFKGKPISRMELDLTVLSDSENVKSDVIYGIHQNPTYGIEVATLQQDKGQDYDLRLSVKPRFYDAEGTQIVFEDVKDADKQAKGILAISSLSSNKGHVEALKPTDSARFIPITGSSIVKHDNGYVYSNEMENSNGAHFGLDGHGIIDSKESPYFWYVSGAVALKGANPEYILRITSWDKLGDRHGLERWVPSIWFTVTSELSVPTVTPPSPNKVKPLKPFTPEKLQPSELNLQTVELPPKPNPKPDEKIPEKLQPPTVHYNNYKLSTQPQIKKSVQNADGVDIDGKYVAKNSLTKWILNVEALPAGRPLTTRLVAIDPTPSGFNPELDLIKKDNPNWDISFDQNNKLTIKATETLLKSVNGNLSKAYKIAPFIYWGRPQNDAADYVNGFEFLVNGGKDDGGYSRKSNIAKFSTPGKKDPDSHKPNDPKDPNRTAIKPEKHNYNAEGKLTDGKAMVPEATNHYVSKMTNLPYKGNQSAKEAIQRGFGFVEDYPEEAVTPLESQFKIRDAAGKEVNGLKMYHVLSKETLTDALKKMVEDSGISPTGAFYMWVAEKPEEFYKAYVQTGMDLYFHTPMKNKPGFTGEYKNQVHQIQFGNGYYSNILKNYVPVPTPRKINRNKAGVNINGKQVLPGSVNYYKVTADYSQYKGIEVDKDRIGKGFYIVDDYPEEAVTINQDGVQVTDSKGRVVKGLKMALYESLEKAPSGVQEALKSSNFTPKGAIQVFEAENQEEYYKTYVQTGEVLTITNPMPVKKELGQTGGKYENTAYQIDFGMAYVTETVVNNVPKIEPKKDVVIDHLSKESLDGKEVKLNQTFNYKLVGSLVPKDRSEQLFEYKFSDDYDETHDDYQSVYQVFAAVDFETSDGQKFKAGDELTKFTSQVVDKAKGKVDISFDDTFLKSILETSEFQAEVYLQMTRIQSGTVENTNYHTVNGVEVVSNTVVNHTPEEPKTPEEHPQQPVTQPERSLPSTGEKDSADLLLAALAMGSVATGLLYSKRKKKEA
ncbi:SspB-related isopeptide-forming adhesin [Streptococcus infantis]|uniref:SspB-related isopeptide-forming adhesin n=1 Tax=Streptococcus infantis TaxID=68892 RepID=UPI0039C3A4C6